MLAVDTNVVVRLLTHDDPGQTDRAVSLFRANEIWIAKTVLLETEWVLRGLYRFSGNRVAVALRALAGAPGVQFEDQLVVAQAIELDEQGFDFADALHLASRGRATKFVSFDEKLVKAARRAAMVGVTLLGASGKAPGRKN